MSQSLAVGAAVASPGVAWRPTVKLALGASVLWALDVWWVGEGLGGVLAGNASPVDGAPGAVFLYALLAVLLWPADRAPTASFAAARAVGPRVARALWLVVWASMAVFAVLPASRAPQAMGGMIARMALGEPGWLAWIDARVRRRVAFLAPGPGAGPVHVRLRRLAR